MTDSAFARPGPYSRQVRLLVYLANAILIATAVVTATVVGKGWSWWLFLWGAGLGVLGLAGNELIVRVTVRIVRPSASDLERLRSRRHDQRLIVFPSALLTGCAIGIIAAGLQSDVPDVLMTVLIVVLELALPVVLLSLLRRRVAQVSRVTKV
ncbi:MAG TPA: hypothetical protein VGL75_15845 [Acidothermaceae bacterium]